MTSSMLAHQLKAGQEYNELIHCGAVICVDESLALISHLIFMIPGLPCPLEPNTITAPLATTIVAAPPLIITRFTI